MPQLISNVIVPTRAADKTLSFIYIYSDCGTEFDNKIISELFLANGIIQDFSCPYTPESHGKIERLWRTIGDMTRTMLFESNLNESYWEHASQAAVYIYNRIITSTGEPSPFYKYYKVQPTLNHVRVFGSLGYCYIPIQLRIKDNSPIREEGILLGYAPGHARNYIMYIPTLNQYIVTDKVEFYENDEDKNVELRKLELLRGVATEVPVQDVSRDPDEYKYLIGTLHFDSDDHKIYKIKRIVVENEFIVGYRQAVTRSGRARGAEDDTPVHIEDLARMTKEYNKVLSNVNTMILNQYPSDISMYRDIHQCCNSTNLLDRIECCVDIGESIKSRRLQQ